ncbi:MAG: EamA family transporter [Candidatus Eisenbacteria bacterium]|nr:EamA family transporter [Candidatus Eisenbacteria bacterium]
MARILRIAPIGGGERVTTGGHPQNRRPLRRWPIYTALFALFLLWSNSFHAISYLRQHAGVPAMDLVTLRFAPVAPLCLLYCVLRWRELRVLLSQHAWALLLVAALTVPGYNLPLNWGQGLVPAETASLLISTNPLFVYLLALLFLGERLRRAKVAGLALALLGVYGLIGFQNGSLASELIGRSFIAHALVVLLAPLSWAAATVIG